MLYVGQTKIVFALIVGAAIGLPSVSSGQGLTQDQVRTRILDQCVYQEWAKRQNKSDVVTDCACAAKETAGGLTEQEVARFQRNERLDRNGRAKYQAALQACT